MRATPQVTSQQAEVLLALAEIYVRLGRVDRGILLADMVVRFSPRTLRAHRILAKAYLAKGWPENVLDHINTLVEHEFDNADLAFALALQSRALFLQGDRVGARRVWAQLVELCDNAELNLSEVIA